MKKLKKIEKKIIFGALFCVFTGAVSFAQSESSLAFQMQNAYDSGFYPGVVLYADQILSSESKSVYEAKVIDIDDSVRLVVELPDGSKQFLNSGEVSLHSV